MQNPSQKVCLSPSQIFIFLCFNLYRDGDDIMGYLQRKTFSPGISFLLFLLLLLGCLFVVCFFDGEWFLKHHLILFPSECIPWPLSLPLCLPLSLSLGSLCVSASGFSLLLFLFHFLVAGLH